jgi:hypothetical protein
LSVLHRKHRGEVASVNGKAVRALITVQAYMLFDFVPVRATSPVTAASLLAGGKWPGVKRERQLKGIPKHRFKLIGEAKMPRVSPFGRASLLHLVPCQPPGAVVIH